MSEWKEYKLGEVCEKIGSGATPQGGSNSYKESGISLIRSQNILDFYFSKSGLAFIDREQAHNLRNVSVSYGDILFNITGDSVARCCIVPDQYLPARVNQHVAIIRPIKSVASNSYLLYFLQSIKQDLLIQAEIGATRNAITKGMLEQLFVILPPIADQERIAGILSSLDDKIELLTRQNRTLESMAETLFRQYFIENPKKEWTDGLIADIAKHSKIAIHPQKQPTELFCHYSIPSFDNAQTPTLDLGVEIQSSKYKVPSNSVLFSKLNPHKDKRVWLLLNSVHDNSICSTEFQIIEPINKEYLYFVYGWLTHSENYNDIASGVGGTSGSHQRIDPATIFSFTCPIIDIDYIRLYNSQVKPMFMLQINNQQQIRSLTKLRDALLPKLMNNEIKL